MSVLGRIARPARSMAGASPAASADPYLWLDAFRSAAAQAGVTVTVERALELPAVFNAVAIVSDTIGTLPLITYRRDVDGEGRERDEDAPVFDLLHAQPNPEMTAPACWSIAGMHLMAWGEAFLGKTTVGGEVAELWPIRPDRVRVRREDGVKTFYLADAHGVFSSRRYTAREIIHVLGPSLDGMRGLSPIDTGRELIGAGLAMAEYANRFFSNSALPRGVLKTQKALSPEGKQGLRQEWEAKYRGAKNAHRVAVLEEGLEFQQLSLSLRESQFAEILGVWVQEIARLFRVPAAVIQGDKGGSLTYSTVEGEARHFLTYSVRPWLVRLESALTRDQALFPPEERRFCEFLTEGLLTADWKTRAEVYKLALDPLTGWLDRDEVRRMENRRTDPADEEAARPPAAALPAPAVPASR